MASRRKRKRQRSSERGDREKTAGCVGGYRGVAPAVSRSVLNAISRSIEAGWPIEDDEKSKLMEFCSRILADPRKSVREKLASGRLMLAANSQNLKAAEVVSKSTYLQHKMAQAAKAAELGPMGEEEYDLRIKIQRVIHQALPQLQGLTLEELDALDASLDEAADEGSGPDRGADN